MYTKDFELTDKDIIFDIINIIIDYMKKIKDNCFNEFDPNALSVSELLYKHFIKY